MSDMEWLAIAYLAPAILILTILMKYFAPRSMKRRLIVVGIATLWPVLAVIIFWPFGRAR